jgi:DnaJ homolog subfamily C member 19
MVFVYLSIGILLVFAIHTSLRWFTTASPRTVRKAFGWIFGIALVALIFFFIRFGMLHFAAIASFLGIAVPLMRKLFPDKGAKHSEPSTASSRMTRKEAQDILGVPDGATAKDIRDAHKRMIQKNHPDNGGTEYLASKINEARDVLLDE